MAGPVTTPINPHSTPSRSHRRPNTPPTTTVPSGTLIIPEDPDEFEKPSDYLSAVSIALMGCQLIASQFHIPGTVAAFDAAIRMIKALRDAQINVRDARRLVRLTSIYSNLLMNHANELSLISSSSDLRMRQLEFHIIVFVKILSKVDDVASRMTTRNPLVGVFSASSDKDELQQLEKKLFDALGIFKTEMLCHIDQNVLIIHDRLDRMEGRIDDLIHAVNIPPRCICPDCLVMAYTQQDVYPARKSPAYAYV